MRSRFSRLVITSLLGGMLALVLAACGGDDPTATPTPRPADPGQPEPTATPVPDFDAEAYFSGKTISLMVGFGQGGGTDAQARFMGANWSKFIPGEPRIIVRNLTPDTPTQRNFTFKAKPDGFTIAVQASPGITDQFETGSEFDMREVSAIGSTSGGDGVWMIYETVPYGCADTAVNGSTELTFADRLGSALDMGNQSLAAALSADLMDLPLRLVHIAGDTGSNTQMLLLERGDTNSWITSTIWGQLPIRRPGWQANGTIKAFLDLSFRGVTVPDSSELPFANNGVQCGTIDDYIQATNPEGADLFYRYNNVARLSAKNIIGPPGIEPEVLEVLRTSLADAIADEEFNAGLEQFSGIATNFIPGAEYDRILDAATNDFESGLADYDALRERLFDKFVQ